LTLKYDAECARCGKRLAIGVRALYDFSTHNARCVVCPVVELPGTPGASAEREFEHRKAARRARVEQQLGDILGDAFLATTTEPQSTFAWERGAIGERRLADTLAGLPNALLLHDRRVPYTRANLDHIVVAPAAVFVVDAKLYSGVIEIRDFGELFGPNRRLFVGRRDRTDKVDNMGWQVLAIQRALSHAGYRQLPLIVPVICFVDGKFRLSVPYEFRGVWLEDARSVLRFMSGKPVLDVSAIRHIHHTLAAAFPPR
jgi:hypothetical protein